MAGFHQVLKTRMDEVEQQLDDAQQSGDDYLVEIRLSELESLVRLAADHGVSLEDAQAVFARHGRPGPELGMTGPIDLTQLAAG